MEPIAVALAAAFNALLDVASPAQQERVLRLAVRQMLAADDNARSLLARSPVISPVDRDGWAVLKPEIRTRLQTSGMTIADLADTSGIAKKTLDKVLSPRGKAPGRLIADRLAAWLETRGAGIPRAEPEQAAVPSSNGVAAIKPASRDTTASPSPPPPSPSPSASSSASSSNGHAALPAPNRLTGAQREKLAGFVALTAPKELRGALGLTAELIGQAVAGRELPGEAVARIAVFLGGEARS